MGEAGMARKSPTEISRAPTDIRRGKSPEAREQQLIEDLALFTVCFAPEHAIDLLQELSAGRRERALKHAKKAAALASRSRQGRLVRELGQRQEASERVRRLMAEAPEGLQRVLYARLPRYHRTLFPERDAQDARPEPWADAQVAFAGRLIREATG
jgi:hypothetical protein